MNHPEHEMLQSYLAGEVDHAETTLIEAHLAQCDECSAAVAALAAEDLYLSDALLLSNTDAQWVQSRNLWPAVRERITPWYLQPQGYILILTLLVACGWVLDQTAPLLVQALVRGGPVDLVIRLLRTLIPVVVQFFIYLDRGGILNNIWPLPILIGTVYMFRKRRSHSNA